MVFTKIENLLTTDWTCNSNFEETSLYFNKAITFIIIITKQENAVEVLNRIFDLLSNDKNN